MEVGSLCCHNSFDAENGGFMSGRITEYVPIIRMCEVNNLDGFTASFFGHEAQSIITLVLERFVSARKSNW